MTFQRRWDRDTKAYVIDRSLTGPPIVPETGTKQAVDGAIVGDTGADDIPPATPVIVTMPGPREPLVDSSGIMTPRWRRFFEEMHRRTGQGKDNVNDTNRNIGDSTTGTLAFAGQQPVIVVA